jgi:transposase-like protein
MTTIAVHCPDCQSIKVIKYGKDPSGKQRYKCQNPQCPRTTFILTYTYKGHQKTVKEKIVDMAMNGSGIRDTARVLQISPNTVIETLKKRKQNLYL